MKLAHVPQRALLHNDHTLKMVVQLLHNDRIAKMKPLEQNDDAKQVGHEYVERLVNMGPLKEAVLPMGGTVPPQVELGMNVVGPHSNPKEQQKLVMAH